MIDINQLPAFLQNVFYPNEVAISIPEDHRRLLVTNKRIIDFTYSSKLKSIDFIRIYKVEFTSQAFPGLSGSIALLMQPNIQQINEDAHKIIHLSGLRDISKVRRIVEEAWFPESPYMISIRPLNQIINKYNLTLSPILLDSSKTITITGEIDGMNVSFLLHSIFQFNQLTIRITCPNPEDNYFHVRPEKLSDSVGKLFGKQDIQIDDKAFNRNFLLQSDNQHFFDYIMQPYIQNMITDAWKWVEGKITFGEEKKKDKKSTKKENIDILDDYLIDEIIPPTAYDTEKMDFITYQCTNIRKNIKNTAIMIEECMQNFETTLAIARRIKEYHENKTIEK